MTASAGCLRTIEYKCASDAQCGSGQCGPAGFCSFADSGCAGSMQRYGESAGSLSNTCVGGPGDIDAGVDSTGIDATPSNCPSDFAPITGGTTGHVYKLVSVTDPWDTQRLACSGMGTAYLAIPDTAAELEAVVDFNGGNKLWVGISDRMTEGTFLNVKDVVQTFLPWKQGAPTTSPPNNQIDCVMADSTTEILDSNCASQQAAVCECDL